MGLPYSYGPSVTVDRAGRATAAMYREHAGEPSTDPTAAIPTTGASGSYYTASGTCASTITPAITDLAFDVCVDTGHLADKEIVILIVVPGLGLSKDAIDSTYKHRLASYTMAGRAFAVVPVSLRGRGASGNQKYVKDTQDIRDIAAAAAALLEGQGATVFASGAQFIPVGYSTGGFDVAQLLSRCPEAIAGAAVVYYPNHDIGADAERGYYQLVAGTQVSADYFDTQVGARGRGLAADVAPYVARNPNLSVGRLLACRGAPRLDIYGDEDEARSVPIPPPSMFVASCIEGGAKVHGRITKIGDADRILHNDGINGAGTIASEPRWVPYALANAAAWKLPRVSPPGGFIALGWWKMEAVTGSSNPALDRPGLEVWTGPNASPKSDAAGGTKHAFALEYNDAASEVSILPITAEAGYYEAYRGLDVRKGALTPGSRTRISFNESPTLAALSDVWPDVFHASDGVTEVALAVSNWAALAGGKSFATAANHPALFTDGDGKLCIRFTAASSTSLIMTGAIVDVTRVFTLGFVLNERSATANKYLLEISNTGTNSHFIMWRSTGTRVSYLLDGGSASGIGASNIERTTSTGAKHWIVIQRTDDDILRLMVDGVVWSEAAITADTFTQTGTLKTGLGHGFASGAVYLPSDVDYYTICASQTAIPRPLLDASWEFLKTHDGF